MSSFTPQQDAALAKALDWFKNSSEQVFRIMGFAGTGKTTIAKFFADNIEGHVQYSAFTGKACQVLRNKECFNAATMHSLIYKPMRMPDGNMKFVKNVAESPLLHTSLIILDEVSMVGEELGKDLLSFGKKVLVLGDPAQLPPVKSGDGYFMAKKPEVMLTEIHRQAAENPIIALSMHLRAKKGLQSFFRTHQSEKLQLVSGVSVKQALAADQIICGKNATRIARNARMRGLKGFTGNYPNVGEKLICLKNSSSDGLFNGQMWQVTGIEEKEAGYNEELEAKLPAHLFLYAKSLDDNGLVETGVMKEMFDGGYQNIHWTMKANFNEFDYGYCVTCHKSQGSQWNNIVLFDEGYVFGEDKYRWLYTAVTRAADTLTIVSK